MVSICQKFKTDFSILRILDNRLVSDSVSLTVAFEEIKEGTVDAKESAIRIQAITTWVTEYVNNSIAVDVNTDVNMEFLEQLDNNVIMCPAEPYDWIMAQLMYAKIKAFAGTTIGIKHLEFDRIDSKTFSCVISGNDDDDLPSMQEWVGPRFFHSKPWWHRTDSSTIDKIPEPNEDLSSIPDLGVELVNLDKPTASPSKSTSWTPRIIRNND